MASKLVKFSEKMVTIMGLRGLPADNGKDWYIDVDFSGEGGYVLVQVSPSILPFYPQSRKLSKMTAKLAVRTSSITLRSAIDMRFASSWKVV